uniref:HAT1 n=1 Tax=Arundo donax TaxID=35708 RepID=A0A0A8ZLZ8_ARUDO
MALPLVTTFLIYWHSSEKVCRNSPFSTKFSPKMF